MYCNLPLNALTQALNFFSSLIQAIRQDTAKQVLRNEVSPQLCGHKEDLVSLQIKRWLRG